MAPKSQNISKGLPCGCIALATHYMNYSYATLIRIAEPGCGTCTEESKEKEVTRLWLSETENYTAKELIEYHGWFIGETGNHKIKIDEPTGPEKLLPLNYIHIMNRFDHENPITRQESMTRNNVEDINDIN